MNVRIGTQASTLGTAADVLALDPTASLAQIAEAAGIGRTTLHKRYPKRQDLLLAVAHDSIEQMERALAEAGVTDPAVPAADALPRLMKATVDLGSRVAFLFRQPSLDPEPEIRAGIDRLEQIIAEFIGRAQEAGLLRRDQPAWWVASSLNYVGYAAWEAVALGRLAPLDAPRIALDTALAGLGARP